MKIAILNDTHTGIRNSSEIFLKNAQDFYENIFFPECDKHDIKQIVHLGDYYDHRKFVNFKALNHNRKHFLNELRKRGMSMDFESLLTLMKQGKEMLEAVIDIEKEMESSKYKRKITMLKKAGK